MDGTPGYGRESARICRERCRCVRCLVYRDRGVVELSRRTTRLLLLVCYVLCWCGVWPAEAAQDYLLSGPYEVPARYRLVVAPYRSGGQPCFSTSYLHWGVIRSEGRQIQYGQLLPALVVVDGRIRIETEQTRDYPRSDFWMAAGPVLVRDGRRVPIAQMRQQFPHLDYRGRRRRVCAWLDRQDRLWLLSCEGSIARLQQLLLKLGARDAINLDGGSGAVWRTAHHRIRGSQVGDRHPCLYLLPATPPPDRSSCSPGNAGHARPRRSRRAPRSSRALRPARACDP